MLEHLREPEQLLRRLHAWLCPDGCVVASVPNVRHHSVVRGLLDGHWTYELAGLLDRTHLHFFTRRDLLRWFTDHGFSIDHVEVVPGPGYAAWVQQGRPAEVQVGRLGLTGLPVEEAEEFFVYQYLVTARPGSMPTVNTATATPHEERKEMTIPGAARALRPLRILYLGYFSRSWRHETQTALALARQGHTVHRFQEHLLSVEQVLRELQRERYNCLLFYKGRLGARRSEECFFPDGQAITEVLQRSPVPGYTWYVDRVVNLDFDPSRAAWMQRVAPWCRVAFVADAALLGTAGARWHVLREPLPRDDVQKLFIPEAEKKDLAFLGQLYGPRAEELAPLAAAFHVDLVQGVYGSSLSATIGRYRIVLGPHYPCGPGYWGNRIYVVLGHGGFFLAPEVPGLREEGLIAGEHYAAWSDQPVADVRFWLAHPEERQRIARAGQELVLRRFTYDQAVQELVQVITETLP